MVSAAKVLDEALSELVETHAAHTVILYGSRAQGTHRTDSDYDIAAFAPATASIRLRAEPQTVFWTHSSTLMRS